MVPRVRGLGRLLRAGAFLVRSARASAQQGAGRLCHAREGGAAGDSAERAADKITHETITLLHRTFITPFDRETIHALITKMDDILDLIQDVTESIALYDLRAATPEAKQLAEICQQSCDRVKAAVGLLTNLKDPQAILKSCEEIDRLESDADRVMRSAMSKLFREENDLKQVMKLRVIYDLLESITDRCEDVANIIEGIVLENS